MVLQYYWATTVRRGTRLALTDGRTVEVLSPGVLNREAVAETSRNAIIPAAHGAMSPVMTDLVAVPGVPTCTRHGPQGTTIHAPAPDAVCAQTHCPKLGLRMSLRSTPIPPTCRLSISN